MEERILKIFGEMIDFVLEVALSWSWNQSNVGKFSYCTGFFLFWFFILFKKVAERLVVGALGLLKRNYIFQSSFERFEMLKQGFLFADKSVNIFNENCYVSIISSLDKWLELRIDLLRSHRLLL